MNRTRRDSSATSKSLLSRQLASITDTLAKASQRRDEEMKRTRREPRASTATTDSVSQKKPTAPAQRGEVGHRRPTPPTVYLCGQGDEENGNPYHAPHIVQQEKAEDVRQECKVFEKLVKGKGPDDPEREKMIEYLFARSKLARTNAQKEVLWACLKAEEERVDDDKRIVREMDIDKFKDLMLEEGVGMEPEDHEARLEQLQEERTEGLRMRAKKWARSIRSQFVVQTKHAALFRDPEEEKAELARLEEGLFEHLIVWMEAHDANHLEAVATSRGSEEGDEGNTKFNSTGSHGSFPMGLSPDEQGERSLTTSPQFRDGKEDNQDVEHHQSSLAASGEPKEAQQEATAPAAAAIVEEERVQKLQDKHREMVYRVKACDIEREGRVEVAQRRALREKAGRTSGLASDETFEYMQALQEAEDCELVEVMKRQRQEVRSSDADGSEEAVLNKSAEEELSRRKSCTEAERSYLLPPASPPKRTPPPYTAAEFEDVSGIPSQSDTVTRGGMRGGHATPLDDNPGALLAELAGLGEDVQLSEAEIDNTVLDGDDLGHMLAEFDRHTPSTHAPATAHDNPREMLEELLLLSAPDPRELRSPTSEDFEEEDDDINALRARLEGLRLSPARSVTPAPASFGLDEGRDETTISGDLPSEAIPYAIALELELSDCEWAVAQGWTRYLFGSGLNSYEAQREKGIAVAHAEEALRKTVASVMKVEEENHRKEEESRFQRRLIVSNLAAGADVEELERQFWQYRHDIVEITMLPDRDALKRTQTAHVDFCSRKSAVQASFISSQIYGLIFDVKLAVPVDDGCGRCV